MRRDDVSCGASPPRRHRLGQLDLDPNRLVFIDETAANTAMAHSYGRALRGERCRMSVP